MCSGTCVCLPGRGCSANLDGLGCAHCVLAVALSTVRSGRCCPSLHAYFCCPGAHVLCACLCCAGAPLSSIPTDQLLALLELHIVVPVPVIDAIWTTPFFGSDVTLDTLLSSGWGTSPGSTPAATIRAVPASDGWVLYLLAPWNAS